MAGRIKYLQHLDGRYYTRITVPPHLRKFLDNKTELRVSLGADRRTAMRKHTMAVADLMHRITLAERRAAEEQGIPQPAGRYPLSEAQIARHSYEARVMQDWEARKTTPAYASIGINDIYVGQLRDGIAGRANDAELDALVGHRIAHYRKIGNTTAERGTPEWRSLAMALCVSEYEALERLVERDEGIFTGTPQHPLIRDAEPVEDDMPPVSLRALFRDYIEHLRDMDRSPSTLKKWNQIFENLREHLRHDDARRITKADIMAWRDKLLLTRSAKTVKVAYLSAVGAAFNWAVAEDRLQANPAENVRQHIPKQVRSRGKGFSDDEALKILVYSRSYRPSEQDGRIREYPTMTAAKQWAPIICALTGARITEITQLRKQDVQKSGEIQFLRITPDAGSVKTGQYRDVPLHPQLIDLGFLEFVQAAQQGPLFYVSQDPAGDHERAKQQGNRLATWLRESGLVPEGLKPNHAWRHRFKTVCRETGVSDRVADAICGHAGRTAGDDYGDVTIAAKARLIEALPSYTLGG